ncbi:MAG TPA: two-component system response regulator CreB [Spirochaetota bacterium]|nr:two-component system response regulator CreB [Spirochaetota bacterium]HPS85497.1 two-component system response regulator CreB [Spirochaetota bacterium]
MPKKILLIEDESGIADTIIYPLSAEGFQTHWVTTGTAGLTYLKSGKTDLVILDIGLPDINGFDVLKEIRKINQVPVLCLTARSDEIDRVLGLELGADDYVIKPFSPRELAARVKAILRRTAGNDNVKTASSPFQIEYNKRQISYHGTRLNLTRIEYEILILFINRPGWIFSRDRIMDMAWPESGESFDRTVDTHIKTLRTKLKEVNPDVDPIETHRGTGYSLREDL